MSKIQFFEMREEQLCTMYDSNFTKKEAVKTGKTLISNILENGNVSINEVGANLAKLQTVVDSAMNEFRANIIDQEKTTVLGVEFSPVNGGNTINYKEDEIYCILESDLKARAELLKLAQKQEVLDTSGNLVPKVSTTPRKSSVAIKF